MKEIRKPTKVFVGLSGGVDSAVSAALLKEQGYDVTGVFMKNWSGDDFGIQSDCPWEEDQKSAEEVANHLGIPFRSYNFEKEYRVKVVDYFFSEYAKGRTPNPDVMCNKEIKFELFLNRALADGADMIATGHYARVRESKEQITKNREQEFQLLKGLDSNKDQTYFLYNLTQKQLTHVLFPIGHLPKPEVRKLAKKFGLPNAERPDSQGICFIGEIDVYKFLRSKLPEVPGDIVDIDTQEKVGRHTGVTFYTIGQREGLGIGGQETPYFVVKKDIEKNILYVGHGNDHPAMYQKEVQLENLHFVGNIPADKSKLEAAVRYRNIPQGGILDVPQMKFTFDKSQRAVTSGQSLVLYDGEICLGGGVIK